MEKFKVQAYHKTNPGGFFVDISGWFEHEGAAYAYGEYLINRIISDAPTGEFKRFMSQVQCIIIKTTKIA